MADQHDQLTYRTLLASIRQSSGAAAERTADYLIKLAPTLRAEPVYGSTAVSLRIAGSGRIDGKWFTLFLVSEAGTFYVNWIDRWVAAGVPPECAVEYEQALKDILQVKTLHFHPSAYGKAVPLQLLAPHLHEVTRIVAATAAQLHEAISSRV